MTERDEVLAKLYAEAHNLHSDPRRIAAHVVSELDRLAGSGEPWVAASLAEWSVTGAMKACADWRRRQAKRSVTVKSGRQVEVPAWGSARSLDDAGAITYEQVPFDCFTVEQLEDWIGRTEKARNTLSQEVAAARVVLAFMQANAECRTAGDAIAALGMAA